MSIILNQLGGNKFIAMTGAKNFVRDGETKLRFNLPRNRSKGSICVVSLDRATDLYSMSFFSIRGVDVTLRAKTEGLFAEDLPRTFTAATGLDVRL